MVLDQALPVGTRLGGCTVDAVLAADEFGFVYRMSDSLLLGRVVIKEYFPQALAQRAGTEVQVSPASEAAFNAGFNAFAEEARVLTRLRHPGLVEVLDSFGDNRTLYQVMPYVAGLTLADARELRDTAPSADWLRELMLAMLDPVEALHDAGLVHGDLHPRKVLLRQGDGQPLLLGFGSARRALNALPDAYAPLEQTPMGAHLPRGAWTDLYSIGAVTWFAATGMAPVPASARSTGSLFVPATGMEAALAGNATQRDRGQLIAAVDRAMALRPPDRLQSGAELRALFTAPAPASAPLEIDDDVSVPRAPSISIEPELARVPPSPVFPPPAVFTAEPPLSAPRRRHVPRRASLGVWTACVAVAAVGVALAWRWGEVMQASRTLARAISSQSTPDDVVAQVPARPSPPVAGKPVGLPEAGTDLHQLPAPAAGPPAVVAAVPAPAEPEPAPETAEPPSPPKAEADPAPEPARKPATRQSASRSSPRVSVAAAALQPAAPPTASPRSACGGRENFSLYYCMQTQCRKPQYSAHAQCRTLRETGEVG